MEAAVAVNHFAEAWTRAEASVGPPQRARDIIEIDYASFLLAVEMGARKFAERVVYSLYSGDCWIVRGAFPAHELRDLQKRAAAWMRQSPSSFHQMREGTPDFHRAIDVEIGKRYAFRSCYHKAAFYRWNGDPVGAYALATPRWRLVKKISGYAPDEYERNTPKDGVIDRVQVARYLPSIGYVEPHQDAHENYRVNVSGYMSKRGVDYEGGGLYLVDQYGDLIEIEKRLEVGDATLTCPSVIHGVAPCDRGKLPDWEAEDGRWSLLMYAADSDEIASRHTGRPVRDLDLEGVLPA